MDSMQTDHLGVTVISDETDPYQSIMCARDGQPTPPPTEPDTIPG